MARARVADFERDLYEAAGGFADQLLCADDTLSRHELQRRHPRCVLEHTGKVEATECHQLGQRLDGNAFCEVRTDIVFDLAEPCDW